MSDDQVNWNLKLKIFVIISVSALILIYLTQVIGLFIIEKVGSNTLMFLNGVLILLLIIIFILFSDIFSVVIIGIPNIVKEISQGRKLLRDAPEHNHFVLKKGKTVENVNALIFELMKMSPKEFSHYVNEKKNDIAEWIEHVFKNKELADEIRKTKRKGKIIILLDESLKKAKE